MSIVKATDFYLSRISEMATEQKPKLLISWTFNPEIVDQLKKSFEVITPPTAVATPEFILNNVAGKHAIFCLPSTPINKVILDMAGPQLTTIVTISAGYEHIDIEECKKRKIAVGNNESIGVDEVAEYTIGLMLATARRFKDSIALVKSGEWWKKWNPATFKQGVEIKGSTVGIVGLGKIGQQIARLLQPFQVKQLLYCGPSEKPEGKLLNANYVNLEELLKTSDFVVVSCKINKQNREMFNTSLFNLMKPTSIFINIARGSLVNHDDLYEALVNKRIWAAGLDVATPEPFPPEHPLAHLENCLLLPHTATFCVNLVKEKFQNAINNLVAGVNGKPMPSQLV